MTEDFSKLIGRFIHHCGVLEFLTNNSIIALATDRVLSTAAIKSPLNKRVVLLRQLLRDRSDINTDDIDSLCDELDEIRKQRNIVAHNPIMSTKPNGSGREELLVLRYKPEGVTIPDKVTKEDVAKLVRQTKQLILRFTELIPEATET
jgi:hypothetical protein